MIGHSRRRKDRRGSAAIEFALVAIPLFLFFFASVELGRGLMARQCVEEAARAGCRKAILVGLTTSDVENEVRSLLNASGITDYTVTVDPTDLSSAQQWDPITVSVSTTFDHVSWLPLPRFLAGQSLSAACTMGREGEEEPTSP